MKKTTRFFAGLLVLVILATTMAACGSSTPTTSSPADTTSSTSASTAPAANDSDSGELAPGYLTTKDEPITLQWYINFSWFPRKWEGSAATKKYTEDTGINVELIVPAGNETEKLNTLIASGSLPDLLTMDWSAPQINEMIEADMLLPLNKLADEYDPYFYEVAAPARLKWYTKDDGNVYGYPNSSYTFEDYEKYDNIASNQTFNVRKDMYEELGSPDMTTTDGFLNALRAAKEKFPEVDGQPLIPIGFHEFNDNGCWSLERYLQNHLAVPMEKDGKLNDRVTDPEYIKWLKMFRQAGEEGLLVNDIFVDKRSQMEEKIVQGRYFSHLYQRTDFATQQKIIYASDHPERIYMAVDGPRNENKDNPQLPGSGIAGWTLTLISANTQYPDRCIQFFTYFMLDETQLTIKYGPEGIGYTLDASGNPVWIPEARKLQQTDTDAFENQINGGMWMLGDGAKTRKWADPLTPPLAQLEEWTYPYAVNQSQFSITAPSADSAEMTAKTKIEARWGRALPQLLLAPTEAEFDRIFDEFLKGREEDGYQLWYDYQQNQVTANKAKLGMN